MNWTVEHGRRWLKDLGGNEWALVKMTHLSKKCPWIVYCYSGPYHGEWQGFSDKAKAVELFEQKLRAGATELVRWELAP